MRRFNGASLAYVRVAAELPTELPSPEGICFLNQCMYVMRWVPLTPMHSTADSLCGTQGMGNVVTMCMCPAWCSADAANVVRFPWDAESGEFAAWSYCFRWDLVFLPDHDVVPWMVPWTMITGPDGKLFLSVDIEYFVRYCFL